MPFEYLPHTADVKIQADGATMQEAFSDAARAITHVMTEEQIESRLSFPLSLEADSKEALFFDFLSEIIVLLDTEGLFVSSCSLNISRSGRLWLLSGQAYGDEARKYKRHGDVKAPTYHDLLVEKLPNERWRVRATLDI
jgi:SHS2 domain-containing protein